MRVAILSAMHASGEDQAATPRGLLTVAGRSVIALQLEIALRLGCERIVCLSEGLNEQVLPLLHRAEQGGASFHALSGARALSGLVKAQDELFVFAEGVVPDPRFVGELLGERSGIIALPAEPGVEEGYERIDRDHAWAGVARLPGSAVERLAEMPFDVDAVPALLRVGLQSGIRLAPLPKAALNERRWTFLRDEHQARSFEAAWLQQRVSPASFAAPSHAVADRAAISLAPRLLARRGGAALPFVMGLAALGGAVAAASGQMPVVAFAATGIGAFLLRMGGTLVSLARDDREERWLARTLRWGPGALIDATILAAGALVAPPAAISGWLFATSCLLLALRLAGRWATGGLARTAGDRTLLAGVLVTGAATGQLLPILQGLALATLAILYFASVRPGITRV